MKRLILLFILVTVSTALDASVPNTQAPQPMKVSLRGDQVVVSNGAAKFSFRGDFVILRTETDPQMSLRTLPKGRFFAPTWVAENLDPSKGIAQIKRSKSSGGDGIDDSASAEVKGRTFDLFAAAPSVRLAPQRAHRDGDTIRFVYPLCEWGRLECKVYGVAHSAPCMEYRFTPNREGYYSIGYLGAESFSPEQLDALWQPMIWQRRIFPPQSYMTLAYTCPIPATLICVKSQTMGVAADSSELAFDPLPTRDNNRFGVALRNADRKAQPMLFAPVLGHVGSQMKPGSEFRFRMRLWVESNPVSTTYKTMARNLYNFSDYRRNAISTLNNTIDNIIDYTLSPYSNFIDSLKGCSYSTDVPGSTKNVSSLNPLSVALIADDSAVYHQRAYPIVEYMLSRKSTLFCLDTTIKVQNPSRELAGPCATVSELAQLYRLSQGRGKVFKHLSEEKYYKQKPLNKRIEGAGGKWYDALEMYRATGRKAYLDYAKKEADKYIASFIDTAPTTMPNAFFWNRYAPFYINLMELYEQTGERRYLDAAQKGAYEYAMFVWMVPQIPSDSITVNKGGLAPWYWYLKSRGIPQQHCPEEQVAAWRLSEIGLVAESSTTCIGHRAVFMAHHAPYMMRIANQTNDRFLHDIARSAIVGRYANFPGYHINTDRTTAYEKPDFPLHTHDQMSVNSFHYNHPFPLLSVLYDYLVTDAEGKSKGAIRFDGDYIEGYGYLQAKFHGNRPGRFYDREKAWLWMPRRLLVSSNVELNYLAARGEKELLIALTNQSPEALHAQIALNKELLPQLRGQTFGVEVWQENQKVGESTLNDGKIDVEVAANGITALIIKDLAITPRFQQQLLDKEPTGWEHDYAEIEFGRSRAMMLNMGRGLKSAYIYLQDDDSRLSRVTLTYRIDSQPAGTITDTSYPFEFTLPLKGDTEQIVLQLTGISPEGKVTQSEFVKLEKN